MQMDFPGDKEVGAQVDRLLSQLRDARNKLTMHEVVYYGHKENTAGLLFINYSNMILNRNIDLFDDAIFMLENEKLSSACIIARCVMETHAVGLHAYDEVEGLYLKGKIQETGKRILKFINSSRFKMEEQKNLKAGKFTLSDFKFTDEAKVRMINEAAQSVHIMNAMRLLFALELKQSGKKESVFEITYNALSEWVHPSQTSLFHKYAKDAQRIETSIGSISLAARSRLECVEGLKLIQFSGNLHRDMVEFGKKLHQDELKQIY